MSQKKFCVAARANGKDFRFFCWKKGVGDFWSPDPNHPDIFRMTADDAEKWKKTFIGMDGYDDVQIRYIPQG